MPSVENGYRPSGETQSKFRRILTTAILLPIFPAVGAFSKEVKRQVRQDQHNICAETGIQTRKLEIHHQLPQCMGGSDRIENAIGLAGEKDKIDAHEKYDRLAIDNGIMFNGKPISEAEPSQIKNQNKWQQACHRFNLK